jgi:hypothetical protein
MPRESFVFDRASGQLVPRDEYYARRPAPARGSLPAPMVIGDNIELRSMTDGQMYTSKAALRRAYRQQGYIEVGDAWDKQIPTPPKPKPDRKAIRDSVGKAFNRVGLPTT